LENNNVFSVELLINKNFKNQLNDKIKGNYKNPFFFDLILKMIESNPNDRIDINEILNLLNSFKDNKFEVKSNINNSENNKLNYNKNTNNNNNNPFIKIYYDSSYKDISYGEDEKGNTKSYNNIKEYKKNLINNNTYLIYDLTLLKNKINISSYYPNNYNFNFNEQLIEKEIDEEINANNLVLSNNKLKYINIYKIFESIIKIDKIPYSNKYNENIKNFLQILIYIYHYFISKSLFIHNFEKFYFFPELLTSKFLYNTKKNNKVLIINELNEIRKKLISFLIYYYKNNYYDFNETKDFYNLIKKIKRYNPPDIFNILEENLKNPIINVKKNSN
jgi:hypothetical protein